MRVSGGGLWVFSCIFVEFSSVMQLVDFQESNVYSKVLSEAMLTGNSI
jgi:hypothetical protein